jgi:hypothetical protein
MMTSQQQSDSAFEPDLKFFCFLIHQPTVEADMGDRLTDTVILERDT